MKLPLEKIRIASVLFFLVLTVNFMAAQELNQHVDNPGQTADKAPTGHVPGVPPTLIEPAKPGPTCQAVVTGNGINYHNGPVMRGNPVNAYIVWYGNWNSTGSNTAATKSLIEHFLGTIGGSNIEKVNTTYGDTTGNVSGNVRFGGSTTNTSTANLSDAGVQSVVANALNAGALPRDSNGVYFVLTSSGVSETSGFCTQYCGWHDSGSTSKGKVRYAFVGNPDRCPTSCTAQTTGPNGNAGADGMASIIAHESEEAISDPDINVDSMVSILAHEISEAVTDPGVNTWYDTRGNENADKCAWTFGTESTASNGAKYNVTLGSRNYLLQENWVNASGGYCAMSY